MNPILVRGVLPIPEIFPILKAQQIELCETRNFAYGQTRITLLVGRLLDEERALPTFGLLVTSDGLSQRIDLFYVNPYMGLLQPRPNDDFLRIAEPLRQALIARLEEHRLPYTEPSEADGIWTSGSPPGSGPTPSEPTRREQPS